MSYSSSGCLTFAGTFLFFTLSATFSAMATVGEIGQVHSSAFSPDGSKILYVSEANDAEGHSWASIMLFDFLTHEITGLTGDVREAVLSPDKKTIAYVERDQYHGDSVLMVISEGIRLKPNYRSARWHFSQLKWSRDSKYLTFISQRSDGIKKTIVISPQIGVVLDEVKTAIWQEKPEQLPRDHPLYQKKPSINSDSTVLWGDDLTIYVQAVDGIWRGILTEAFVIQWERVIAERDITGLIGISAMGTHLLYKRPSTRIWVSDIWVLPIETGATPVKVGEGASPQFTPDGQYVVFVNMGLWMVLLDGSSRIRLTRQESY